MKYILFFSVLFAGLFSHAQQLGLTGAEYVFIANIPGRSCESQFKNYKGTEDLVPFTARIGQLHLTWTGSTPFLLESLTIEFRGPGLVDQYQKVIVSGEELNYLWNGWGTDNEVHGSTSSTPFCRFSVGGIGVSDPKTYFESSGVMTLKGSYKKEGQLVPIETQLPFFFHLTPSGL